MGYNIIGVYRWILPRHFSCKVQINNTLYSYEPASTGDVICHLFGTNKCKCLHAGKGRSRRDLLTKVVTSSVAAQVVDIVDKTGEL